MADVITVGVDLQAKVARTLGVSLSEVKHLCGNSHGKTNGDAKFKPIGGIPMNVCRSGTSGETLLVVNSATGYPYWKGMDGNCGWSFPALRSYTEVMNYCTGALNGWVYNAPLATEYNRMGDFIGYWHLAPRFLSGVRLMSSELYTDDAATAMMLIAVTASQTYALCLNDINTIAGCYFGVHAVCGSKARQYVASAKVSAGGDHVDIDPRQLTRGTWKMYPFFSTTPDVSLAGTYYPVRYATVQELVIKDASERVTISIRVLDDITLLAPRYVISIRNNTTGTLTCNNNLFYFRKYGKRKNDTLTVGETTSNPGNFTLAAGVVKEFSGTFKSTDLISSGGVTVIASFAQGAYEEIADIAK